MRPVIVLSIDLDSRVLSDEVAELPPEVAEVEASLTERDEEVPSGCELPARLALWVKRREIHFYHEPFWLISIVCVVLYEHV